MAEFILKDWYGKEKTFDKETIYARDVEGNLIPFTQGDGKPTLAPLEVTENGTYEAPDGVDGYSPVTVNVPTPEIVLQDKTITENGTYEADEGYDGLGSVTVNIEASSADIRYVTFMSYDGSVEYGKKAVAVGDDCADPIARGIFDTPTRESDVQYNYTFYGWATEANGGADADWNKTITEDKTVYANFASAVRYYTVTYYDSDGTTVLKTESLAYGATPSYRPSKENYVFSIWIPELVSVNGDASYTAVWEEMVTFATASWAKIAEISEAGKATEYFSIGDTKTFDLTDTDGTVYTGTLAIADFDHDDLADGTGKAGITIDCKVTPNTTFTQLQGHYPSGAAYSTLKAMLPSDLTSVIKTVSKKLAANNSNGTAIETITRNYELFFYAPVELNLKTSTDQGNAYPLFATQENRTVKNVATNANVSYWSRSRSDVSSLFYINAAGGSTSSGNYSVKLYAKFGFCI